MECSEYNCEYDLRDNLPRNAHFWQVGLLDIVLSEYTDKSHNFRIFILWRHTLLLYYNHKRELWCVHHVRLHVMS